jgi:hypothetical protein
MAVPASLFHKQAARQNTLPINEGTTDDNTAAAAIVGKNVAAAVGKREYPVL